MNNNARGINTNKIAYILGNYPGNVEPFVLNEMKLLKRKGFNIFVCPIHRIPSNSNGGADFKAIYAGPLNIPGILLAHLYFMLSRPVPYLTCLLKHKTYGGKRVFVKSLYFAWSIKKLGIKHIHAHFGWTATDSARVISCLTNIPFSFTAHAADIYYSPSNLEAKLKEARFVITCLENNKAYISIMYGHALAQKVRVVYHGVDLETFKPYSTDKVIDILSIGNFVEKKGFHYLITALNRLKNQGLKLKCLVIGDGPEKKNIKNMIRDLDLEDSVEIAGRQPQAELPFVYARSRVFVLPSIITEAGDRDGIPNVIVEAMAMGLPVISTDVPNIAELIENGSNGLLVRQKDAGALAAALEVLLNDSGKRTVIGRLARKRIEDGFNAQEHIQKIAEIFHLECKGIRKNPMEEAVPRSCSRLPGLLKKDCISPLRKIPLFIASYLREIFHGNGHMSCIPYYGQRSTVMKSLEQNGISKHETAKPGTEQNLTYVLGDFHSGLEPFVVNELKELSILGFDIMVFSVYGNALQNNGNMKRIKTLYAEPLYSGRIILSHLYFILRNPGRYYSILRRCRSFRGKKVFLKSVFFARQVLKKRISHVHAHFAWVAADSARLISEFSGATYSVTAHQSDINRYADNNLHEKLKEAKFILTCTKGNKEYLGAKYGRDVYDKTTAVYHGVNTEKFSPGPGQRLFEMDVLSIASINKLKGLEYLIRACAILRVRGFSLRCRIVGKGPEKESLEKLILQLDIQNSVEIRAPVPHYMVRDIYRKTKLFVLPVADVDGTPHGIPKVIVEAMAMGLPVISTDVPDISELIENGKSGLIVMQKNPDALADAIEMLLNDRSKCTAMGRMAREKIEKAFDVRIHTQKIAELLLKHQTLN